MTARVTPLALGLLAAAGWAAALAVLSARVELVLVGLGPLLALGALARRAPAPAVRVEHAVSADRILEGEHVTVTVTATADRPVALLEVLGPLPAGAVVAAGRRRAALRLRPGHPAGFTYEVAFPGRGVHDLGTIVFRARDRSGLRAWEGRCVMPHVLRVYPRPTPLRTLPRPVHPQASVGDYVSPALGEGIEPGDVRPFTAGDRIRQVNWRASLRLGTLHVTQRQRERNADVVIMLDTLAEVGVPPGTTLDHGVRAAASLATAYLARKDRVGLVSYGGVIDWVRPASGRVQYERLADALGRAGVIFTYVAKDLGVVPPRVLPPRALVVAVTPLLDRRFTRAALDLSARGFDLVALVVSPVEITRAALGPARSVALACRLWALERRAQLADLRRQGIPALPWDPAEPLDVALAGSGRRRPRLAIAG